MRIAYISTFPPRQCGIATFNDNLIRAIQKNLKADQIYEEEFGIALNDSGERNDYEYNSKVKNIIRQENREDYYEAAQLINSSDADVCILQHEFGIYGGQNGLYILSLLHRLKKPAVTIFHTILKEPSFLQKVIIREIAKTSMKVVVMNKRAITFLVSIYNIPREKIELIEHGVPDLEAQADNIIKGLFPFTNKKVLMTFGLINRGKGLETVIRALPRIVEKHPEAMYVIVGNTHPGIIKRNGEEYRDHLKQMAADLGVDKHLVFINRFVSEQELINYLSASDVYITPYLNEAQISSGSLSYAIGAGAAVLSTPYWHARELLDENRGMLFDFRDADGLAVKVNDLLDNPHKIAILKQNAYKYGKQLRWPSIGSQYVSMLSEVIINPLPDKKSKAAIDVDRIPKFSLAHVFRLTDSTGIIQHAKYGIPNFKEGYSLDDNARALIMVLMASDQKRNPEVVKLLPVYLSYIHYMQKDDGNFRNFLGYNRNFPDDSNSTEDAFGRTVWALGYLIRHSPADYYRELADELFRAAVPNYKNLKNLRGYANTIIGISYYLRVHPSHDGMFRILTDLTNLLMDAYKQHHDHKWNWFEERLSYDNAILPLALLHASEITGDPEIKKVALETMRFLEQMTFKNGYFIPVGNTWYHRDDEKMPEHDQQAIETMGMVLLYFQAYESTQNPEYIRKMFVSYLWYIGENSLRVPLYDHETKGCCDGLHPAGLNRNQGAESTLAYLLSHLTVLKALDLEYEYNPPIERVESFS